MDKPFMPERQSDLDLAQVLETIPDAVMVVGTDFNVRWVNAAFSRLTGIPFSQAIGKRCYAVFKGNICRTTTCPMASIMNGEESLQFETDKHCACGRSAPGIMTARPFRSHRGELTGMVEIVSDLTPLYESRERFRKAMGGVIQALSFTTEKRFPYTAGHQRRVTKICRIIAEEMGFSWDRTQGLRMASAIHDFGKILVPAAILNKTGEISEHEMAIIRDHPQAAYNILKDVDFPWPIAQIIYQHHERMDGSGYPQGLMGEEILVEARILAVADTLDAITCFRPYRAAMGFDNALAEIKSQRGKQFDETVVGTLLSSLSQGKLNLKNIADGSI